MTAHETLQDIAVSDLECSESSAITEIEIAPDGRLFLFGASSGVLTLLREFGLADDAMLPRIPTPGDH